MMKEDLYSLQSPYIFNLYSKLLIYLEENKESDLEIELFREYLLNDKELIEVLDLGAGSKKVNQRTREIRKITRFSTSSRKFAQLYQYFLSLTDSEYVLELGTCMGITSRYLAKKTNGKVLTLEGSPEIQKIAKRSTIPGNIQFILGPIEATLPEILGQIPRIDFCLIDANHRLDPTIQFFNLLLPKIQENSILAIGDIHWSKEMEMAWNQIKSNPSVRLTLDFWECGIVLFKNPGEKQHLILDI
jgi:predicted O-methyltransferase YrrM